MNQHDDAMWDKAVDAAGATEQRLRAAEHLLREVTPSQLSAATIDTMVMAVTREATPRTRCYGRLLAATMMLVIGLSAAAWRGTQAFWPERATAHQGLQRIIETAMTSPVEQERNIAISVLDDKCTEAAKWLATLVSNNDPCATVAQRALDSMRATLAGAPNVGLPIDTFEQQLLLACDEASAPDRRAESTVQVGIWASVAIRALQAAPLIGNEASDERKFYLKGLAETLASAR